jgi:uncharacterized iron-regulated protein
LSAAAAAVLALAACAGPAKGREETAALLLGEQHDAPAHQEQHARVVADLAARGRLAGLALEMAEQGGGTAGLPPSASEVAVRAALRWDEAGWPWAPYAPAVMAAVRAGVPVAGANLPRAKMRAAMADASLDGLLPAEALDRQREAMRDGHCGLLPESQLGPMARIQVARDQAMAQTVATLANQAAPGQRVVLLAGAAHVDVELGVPRHLPTALTYQAQAWPAQPPKRDYCEDLRRSMAPAAGSGKPAAEAPAPVGTTPKGR